MDDLVQEAEKAGGKIVPVFCDHTNDQQVKELFAQIEREQHGRLDLLVNNAVANVTVSLLNDVFIILHINLASSQKYGQKVL